MVNKIKALSGMFLLLAALFTNVCGASNIQEQMINDLDVVKYQLAVKYAPFEWKKQHLGWDLEEAYNRARMRILNENPQNSQAYQKILSEFIGSTKDYHVGIQYYSTAASFFPLTVKRANNSYYISELEMSLSEADVQFFEISPKARELITKNIVGISPGDEIIAINGQPIEKVIEKLIDENFNGDRSLTGYEFAVRNLFLRRASLGQEVPQGTFRLTVKNSQGKQSVHLLPWLHNPELVANPTFKERQAAFNASHFSGEESSCQKIERLLAKDYSVSMARELNPHDLIKVMAKESKKNQPAAEDDREKGFLPPLGKILWQSPRDCDLYAYLYQHPKSGKKIGYLYLPSFYHMDLEANFYLAEIIHALKKFDEQKADGLVFDISDNTGGNVLFMYAVLSLLTNKPLDVPYEQQILIQEDVLNAATLYKTLEHHSGPQPLGLENLSGYPITHQTLQQLKQYALTIMQTWEAGETFTQPLHIFGIDKIMPHPDFKFKNKPITVLVNSFCFSCADFFPAILQDNKQAVIFGQRTAGAGGAVRPYGHASRFGVRGYSLTASIAYRLTGDPIENLGVKPNISCPITKLDLSNNYVRYSRRINLEMDKLIK